MRSLGRKRNKERRKDAPPPPFSKKIGIGVGEREKKGGGEREEWFISFPSIRRAAVREKEKERGKGKRVLLHTFNVEICAKGGGREGETFFFSPLPLLLHFSEMRGGRERRGKGDPHPTHSSLLYLGGKGKRKRKGSLSFFREEGRGRGDGKSLLCLCAIREKRGRTHRKRKKKRRRGGGKHPSSSFFSVFPGDYGDGKKKKKGREGEPLLSPFSFASCVWLGEREERKEKKRIFFPSLISASYSRRQCQRRGEGGEGGGGRERIPVCVLHAHWPVENASQGGREREEKEKEKVKTHKFLQSHNIPRVVDAQGRGKGGRRKKKALFLSLHLAAVFDRNRGGRKGGKKKERGERGGRKKGCFRSERPDPRRVDLGEGKKKKKRGEGKNEGGRTCRLEKEERKRERREPR